ncbi:MAG: dTDP-4-dehydrorhamnose 3,5-epimerase family protein, partial [Oscillospiraceae bacterium]
YKCTDLYTPTAEGGVAWDDKDIGIEWPLGGMVPLLSEKDKHHQGFKEQNYDFFDKW